jgi:hypothetical protein
MAQLTLHMLMSDTDRKGNGRPVRLLICCKGITRHLGSPTVSGSSSAPSRAIPSKLKPIPS